MTRSAQLIAPETRRAETETADCELRFDPVTDTGELTGWAVKFNVVDSFRSSFDPKAFTLTGERIPLLWSHNPDEVIGSVRQITAEPEGLRITAKLNLAVQRAQEARAMLAEGDISGLSIGFRRIADEVRQGGIRHITQAKLMEVSLVAAPSVPGSRVTGIRSDLNITPFLAAIAATTAALKG